MHRAQKITNDPTAKIGISENATACKQNIAKNTARPPILSERAGHRRRPMASDAETRRRVEEEHRPQGVQLPSLEGVTQAPRAPSLLAIRPWRSLRQTDFAGGVPHEPGSPADDGSVDDPNGGERLERTAHHREQPLYEWNVDQWSHAEPDERDAVSESGPLGEPRRECSDGSHNRQPQPDGGHEPVRQVQQR